MNLWDEILARIETKVNRHSFYTWFRPTTFVSRRPSLGDGAGAERLVQGLADEALFGGDHRGDAAKLQAARTCWSHSSPTHRRMAPVIPLGPDEAAAARKRTAADHASRGRRG